MNSNPGVTEVLAFLEKLRTVVQDFAARELADEAAAILAQFRRTRAKALG